MTRRRVAVVSSCCPPLPGQPVTGGGLRTAQLVATLRSAKHAVVLVIEKAALPEHAPSDWRSFEEGDLAQVLLEVKPQVIVLEQWALAERLGEAGSGGAPDVPLVIDLHGSLILENLYRRGSADLTMDGKSKLEALRRADLMLTPAAAQLHHFSSWATLAGFDPRELPLALLPLATTALAEPRSEAKPALRMVYGGARWPWIDSLEWLVTAASVAEKHKHARLDVFTYEPPRHGLPFEEDLGSWPEVDDALKGRTRKGVKLHGRTEHSEYLAFLGSEATVALDLWEPNPERMLASTTRTAEFLASGLPVVTVSGAAWSEELVQSGAGWTVTPGDQEGLRTLLEGLATDPGRIALASRAALRLARDRADLAHSGRALLDFVEKPSRPPRSPRSIVEAIVHVRQTHLDETLRSMEVAHLKEHGRLVAAHKAEIAERRTSHQVEIAELRAAHQGEVASLRSAADAHVEKMSTRHDALTEAARLNHQKLLERMDIQHRAESAEQLTRHAESAESHRAEIVRMTEERRAEMQAAADRHQVELGALRARGVETVAALRAELDAALRASAERAEETRIRTEALAEKHQIDLETLRLKFEEMVGDRQGELDSLRVEAAEAAESARLRAEETGEKHQAEMETLRLRLEAMVSDRQGELDSVRIEAAEAMETARLRTKETENEHQAELEALRVRLELAIAERQGHLDSARETLAKRDQLLRQVTEARDEWKGRWTSDRAQDKEARSKLEVELRAQITSREQELRKESAQMLKELKAELEGQLESMASRKVVRLADSVQGALRGEALGGVKVPGAGVAARIVGETGRVFPAVRLGKLWVEHAMDRERD